jgi:hypothetical protein
MLTQTFQATVQKAMKATDKPIPTPCKLEVILKVTTLPSPVRTVKNGWKQFMLNGEGQRIRVKIRPRAWRKLCQVSQRQTAWAALIKGSMGTPLKDGFELTNPTVQIFEQVSSGDLSSIASTES